MLKVEAGNLGLGGNLNDMNQSTATEVLSSFHNSLSKHQAEPLGMGSWLLLYKPVCLWTPYADTLFPLALSALSLLYLSIASDAS